MKSFLKYLIPFLAIIVLILPVCAQTELTIAAKPVSDGFYMMSAKATSGSVINTAEVFVSYDNTVVVPVDSTLYSDVYVSQGALQGSIAPFVSQMDIAPVRWLVNGTRTAFKVTVYSVEGVDTSEGAELFGFLFRVKQGEKIARDTFRVETELSENSFLSTVYEGRDANSGAGIFVGADIYAATDAREDTVLFTKPDMTFVPDADRILVGDVNQDESIDILDAILLMQKLANSAIWLTNNQLKAADCALSGSLDICDAILLLQYLANKEIEFN